MKLRIRIGAAMALVVLAGSLRAGDWPMWRHDILRSGISSEKLADELHLQWTRKLPPPAVAWPNERRLQFDASLEPVVLGRRLFVGSAVDGSLRAFDTRSGTELWRFYSEGPVRLAPVAWKGTVCFGSDDGFLYSLDAATGKLRWKVRGAPDERGDYRQLGNNRMVSLWPVRGGPVIHEGTVYFGAGIWPSMGVFMKAVDADTGSVKWVNGDINYLSNVRIDHNLLEEAALSPQGYCLFADGKVVAPNGRSMPARFTPDTGELLYFVQGYRHGDSRVTSNGRLLFVGEQGVVSLKDGREVGDRWASAGDKAPNGWSSRRDLFEGPFFPYKFMEGCDYRSIFDGDVAYGMANGRLHGWNIAKAGTSLYEKKIGEQTIHPARWDAPPLWQPVQLARGGKSSTRVIIKSGPTIYTHVDKTLFALRATNGRPPVIAWKKSLEGTPGSMLTADGRLFVALDDGRLLCFGAEEPESVRDNRVAKSPAPGPAKRAGTDDRTRRIIAAAPGTGGYALVVGLESGQLVEALLEQTPMKVIAVDADIEKVNSLRRRYTEAGLYGKRFEAFAAEPMAVKWPPWFASLIVSETAFEQGTVTPLDLYRLLRPYGGTLLAFDARWDAQVLSPSKMPGSAVWQKGNLTGVQREGPLEGAADWTHESGDAARVYFSTDQLVQAPLGILWYGDGPDHGYEKAKDYGRGVKPEVAAGRLVAFDDAEKELKAIDIYTGRLLWKRGTESAIVRMVTFPDAVYVASGLKCEVLDPETGQTRQTLRLKLDVADEDKPGVVALRATEELLLVAIGFNLPESHHSHSAMDHGLWDARVLVGLDRKSGRQLWTRTARHRFNLHSVAVGGGMVFACDSLSAAVVDKLNRRGQARDAYTSEVLALDAATGQPRWRKEYTYKYRVMTGRGPLAIRPYDDWAAYNARHGILLTGKSGELHALDARTGKEKWHSPNAGIQPLILSDYDFINQNGHKYEVETGKLLSDKPLFQRGACNYTVGSDSLLFLRYKSAAYIDLSAGQKHSLRNLRSGCSNSLVAAGGLLNVPCFSTGCVCNYPLQTAFSMYHMPECGKWAGDTPIEVSKPRPR